MRLLASCVGALPLLSACAFLLDFDELQRGNAAGGKDGGGGQSNGGGRAGSAGSEEAGPSGGADSGGDGSATCPTGCDDSEPCTVDTCEASGCTHTYTPGISADGLSEVLRAKTFHRATLSAWNGSFYLSALKSTASGTEVALHAFDAKAKGIGAGKDLTSLANFNGLVPVSAAGIAGGSSALVLKLFVAMGQALGAPAQVWEVTVDPALGINGAVPAAVDDNYAAAATVYPVAWTPSDKEVWVAWPGATAGVFLHRATAPAEAAGSAPRFGAAGGKVTDVAPLAAGSVPGVLYLNARPMVEAVGQAIALPLAGCDAHPGTLTSATSAFTQIDGVWLAGWTKTLSTGSTVAEMKPVLCGVGTTPGCIGSPKCDASDQSYTGIRNPAALFLTDVNNPMVGRVYEAIALPFLDIANAKVGLGLQLTELDFDVTGPDASEKATPVTTSPVPLASGAPGPNNSGPDWPALAFLPPDRLAVAWIEPGDAGGQALHVERHKVCLPRK